MPVWSPWVEEGGGWRLSGRFQTHRWGSDKPVKMMSVKRCSAGWRLLFTLLIGTSASLSVRLSITRMQLCPPAKPCRGPHWADGDWPAAHWGGRPIMPPGWEEDLLADTDWIIIEPCNFWELLKTKVSGPDLANRSDPSAGFTQTCWRQFWNPYQLIKPHKKKNKKTAQLWEKQALLCQRGK